MRSVSMPRYTIASNLYFGVPLLSLFEVSAICDLKER